MRVTIRDCGSDRILAQGKRHSALNSAAASQRQRQHLATASMSFSGRKKHAKMLLNSYNKSFNGVEQGGNAEEVRVQLPARFSVEP